MMTLNFRLICFNDIGLSCCWHNINDLQPEQKIVIHSDILQLENELSSHRPDKIGQQRHSVYSIIKSHHNYTIPLNTWIQLGFQY